MESDPFHQITLDCLINKKHRGKILGKNSDNNKVSQEERDNYGERVINLAKHLLDLSADTDDIYSDVKDSYETFLSFTIQFLKDLDEKEKCTTIDDEYVDTSEYTEAEEETQIHVEELEDNDKKPINMYTTPSYTLDGFVSVKSLPTNKKKYGKK
jgi:hypothetical protein